MSNPGDKTMQPPATTLPEFTHRYGWVIVVSGFAITLTTIGAGRYLYPVILPAMKEELSLTYSLSGALASAIMVGYLTSCLLSGVLAVRFGSRVIIALSTVGLGLAMIGQAFISWYPIALFLMLVIGLGAGGAYIPTAGLVSGWFPPSRRGMFMAIVTVGANFGILSTAVFGPRILEANGGTEWRPAWIYFGLAALAVGLAAAVTIREPPAEVGERKGNPGGGAGKPFQNLGDVFRNRTMLRLTSAYFCHGFFSIYAVFLFAFTTRGLGYETQFAGNLWSLSGVMSAITLVLWGYLSDVWGRRETIIPCAAMLAIGILIPVFRQDAPSLWVSAFLFGASYVGPMTIITVAAGDLVGPAMAAAAMGLVTMGHGLGQMIGPAIGGVLIDVSGSFYPGFVISGIAIVAEILVIAGLPLEKTGRSG